MLPSSLRSSIQGSTYYGREALSHEEEYAFQVAGYLNVPSPLNHRMYYL
eukprot:COSAG02_NODE_27668_length_605_cov_0.509881_2_plen_49_part_00